MKTLIPIYLFLFLSNTGCVVNKQFSNKEILSDPIRQGNFKKIAVVFAQVQGPNRKYVIFRGASTSSTYIFFPLSYSIISDELNKKGYIFSLDKRLVIDSTTDSRYRLISNTPPRTSQWITSEWIHKTALNIQKSKTYELDSVLIRTGYYNRFQDELIFYVFHDVRNPTVGGMPQGNYASIGEDAVRARSYVFGVLNKQVVYYKDHFYKAGDIRKLDSVQVAKITYSLFEDFFKAVKK